MMQHMLGAHENTLPVPVERGEVFYPFCEQVICYSAGPRFELARADQVAGLIRPVTPVMPDDNCLMVLEMFQENPALNLLPVVDRGIPLGLLSRHRMVETFSHPYARELNYRKPAREFIHEHTVIVEKHTHVDELARILVENRRAPEGFIVTEQGRYLGVGTLDALLDEITQRKQAHLYHLAHYDTLTGLPNRLLFFDRLGQTCVAAERAGRKAALLFLDLDGFKYVNDTLGHAVGDFLLKQIAARLQHAIRSSDTLARLGGDEFTVILSEISEDQDAGKVAQSSLRRIARPVRYLDEDLYVTASIGIALFPSDDRDINQLIKKADMAMYQAKESGKNNYQYFSADMNRRIVEYANTERDLRKALAQGQFFLVFQPVVRAADGRITGAEALLRWHHPRRGVLTPDCFIGVAEESGLIDPIGEWVLDAVCAQLGHWQNAGLPPLRMAINVSMRQLQSGDLAGSLESCLRRHGLAGNALMLELTEQSLMKYLDKTLATIERLKALAVQLALDDFGTGYSSLSYLHKLPFDALKIDRSFTAGLETAASSRRLVAAIIAMSHALDLPVIAEGVEKAGHAAFLATLGCDYLQGFYISQPLDAEGFSRLLNAPDTVGII